MALIPIHHGIVVLQDLQGRGLVKLAIAGPAFENGLCRAATAWSAMVQYDKDARVYISSDPYRHPGVLTLDPEIVFGPGLDDSRTQRYRQQRKYRDDSSLENCLLHGLSPNERIVYAVYLGNGPKISI